MLVIISAIHPHQSAIGRCLSPLSWTLLPPHTPSPTTRLSTGHQFELLESNSQFPLAIYSTHGSVHVRRRQWHPTPVLLPGKSHGWRSLVGCSPWGLEESDATEQLPFHLSLSCIGERNGNPLQCSCLENPRDGGAWWAAVYGNPQSWTGLKQLSSVYVSRLLSIFPILSSPAPLCPRLCSLCIHGCPANRFISTIFLDPICLH